MKKFFCCLNALALCFLFSKSANSQSYQLVWSDEFMNTIGPDWNYDIGDVGAGNGELEYYRSENASIENGALVITAKHESYGGKNYTSSRMVTSGKKSWKYGKVEARIKLPAFSGSWPAFWMLGDNIGSVGWPNCGEIDIMEQVNTQSNIFGTIHWNGGSGATQYGNNSGALNVQDFNVYTIEWDANSIKWFVNGTQYSSASIQNGVNNTASFQNKFFILLNLAVGGAWPGYNIDNNAFPAKMYVDYVRVYQQGVAPVCSTVNIPGTLQNENYCDMMGVQSEATTDVAGGQDIGYFDAGDWLAYKINVPTAGLYTVQYRVATPVSGMTLRLESLGGAKNYGSSDVPNTGGWQNWQTISKNIQLDAGIQDIGLASNTGGFNINWMDISAAVLTSTTEIVEPVLQLYPNPVSDVLHIAAPAALCMLSIFDITGREVYREQNGNALLTVDVKDFSAGFYTVIVTDAALNKQLASFVK